MRRPVAAAFLVAAILLAGCGGGQTAGDVASLYESQDHAENVVCKEASPSGYFRCTAHRNGESGARTILKIESGNVVVEGCVSIDPHASGKPCAGIGVVGDEAFGVSN
jgi:hypothetical protein